MATSEFAPRHEKERISNASLRIGFSFRLRAGQFHVREWVRCCDLFRLFLRRFRLLLRARSNRLRSCWNRERIRFRSALTNPTKIDVNAHTDIHSTTATVTMSVPFAALVTLGSSAGCSSFIAARVCRRGFRWGRFAGGRAWRCTRGWLRVRHAFVLPALSGGTVANEGGCGNGDCKNSRAHLLFRQ